MADTEYRIEYTIQRLGPEDSDWTDIGFGSSNGWDTPTQASHIAASEIENYGWETEPGMPDPDAVKAAVEAEGEF